MKKLQTNVNRGRFIAILIKDKYIHMTPQLVQKLKYQKSNFGAGLNSISTKMLQLDSSPLTTMINFTTPDSDLI
uniref:Uncharacterized protein n=3 Tax=Roseolovirus TaxID=40272 RepID=A0A2L2Q912_HHV6H|nr:hypothetical protein [Human betaherpesvirus 6]AVI07525.1 hypothetical protein [Human betaherpesvirus 6B]AVI09414.1 hypothetical protein [Human betaherpesvirus 6B]